MNLGVFLSSGSSFTELSQKGRDELLKSYLVEYSKSFDKVYVFSYGKEKRTDLPANCYLVSNKFNFNRLIYSFLLPFLNKKYLKNCHVLRVMQLTGAIPAIISGKIYCLPVVATYGYDYQKFALMGGKLVSYLLLRILEPLILNNLDAIIATTPFLQRELKRKTNKPIFFIPNSVDTNLFKPKKRIFNKNKIRILSVGRLEKQKNLDSLIKAISLSKHKKNIYLNIIGKGSLKSFLKNLAKKNNVKLQILEGIPHNKMPQYYQGADIFCLVSLIEGHPKSLLEALSCSLPCLVSRNQGNLSIIKDGENGLAVDNIISTMAKKIDLLIQDKDLRKKLARNGRQRIRQNFDREKILDKEITVFKNV